MFINVRAPACIAAVYFCLCSVDFSERLRLSMSPVLCLLVNSPLTCSLFSSAPGSTALPVAQAQTLRVTPCSSCFSCPRLILQQIQGAQCLTPPHDSPLLSTTVLHLVLTATAWHWEDGPSFLLSLRLPSGCSSLSSPCEPLQT